MSDAGVCCDCERTMDLEGVSDPEPDDFVCYECQRDRALDRVAVLEKVIAEQKARLDYYEQALPSVLNQGTEDPSQK